MVYTSNNTVLASRFSILILVFAFSSILPVENARILAVQIALGKSHWNVVSNMLRVLSDNGHNITVFSSFTDGNRENYTEVDISKEYPELHVEMDLIEILKEWNNPISIINTVRHFCRLSCDVIYKNVEMNKIMEKCENSDFDLVIIELLGVNCVSYLATKLNLPVIYVIASPMITYSERSVYGYVPNPASISHLLSGYAVPKTFIQRLSNTALLTYSMFILSYDEWIIKYTNPKPYDLITHSVPPSLIFVNSHFISEASRPFPPNVIQIGGVHLKQIKSIPNDILEFVDNSPHGVILLTFGSTIKVASFPKHILNAFKEALAQVPQRILWKYEEEMENIPQNVMTRKWFPQRDLLMHPKVKLFISHGGISGIYETVDAGVPVLGFPLFYDQPKNIDNLVDAGMAISMDILSVKSETLLKNILKLVTNENYTRNAKIASDRFKDRPMSPQQSILYWTEYVIRHKGAPHLIPHALHLTWYQYFLLDVIVVAICFILISLLISHYVLKSIYSYILVIILNVKEKSE